MNITDYKPVKKRVGRGRRQMELSSPTPPVETLTLIAATYLEDQSVTLTFNQAIDASAYFGKDVFIDDAQFSGNLWEANGALTVLSPTTIRVELSAFDPAGGTGVTLTAPSTTGITSAGGTWAGVTNLELPFGY